MSGKLRLLERALFVTGAFTAVLYTCLNVPVIIARVQRPVVQPASDGAVIPNSVLGSAYLRSLNLTVDGGKIATISIPQIHLTAPVVEGVSESDLRRGVGHVAGSALSGGLGNMVLAAHRDTIFRPLRAIQKGMDVQLKGGDGTFHYQVDSFEVVAPSRLEVLEISDQPEVTLITCYPFNFIGSAPMRFVVKAHLVSAVPDKPTG